MDIVTRWVPGLSAGDWLIDGGDLDHRLAADGARLDLETAVLISIFTDARAGEDELVPDGTGDRRGWWGGPIGSKLWLRVRSKATPQLLPVVKADIMDALQWLLDDGVAAAVEVDVDWQSPTMLAGTVSILRANGSRVAVQFERLWNGEGEPGAAIGAPAPTGASTGQPVGLLLALTHN